MQLMESLLVMEAEAKSLLGLKNRSGERTLLQEMLKILKEAEYLFGARDVSYALLPPRITECSYAQTYILYPLRMIRIYLTGDAATLPWLAALELAHEVVHVLCPAGYGGATVLEEGLAEYMSYKYVNREFGLTFGDNDPRYDAARREVKSLLAENEFVIKELRTRQPVISKIDEQLLVEATGIELDRAKFLCTRFDSLPIPSLRARVTQDAQRFVRGLNSIWS